jgi:hypothetical protein
MDLFQQILYFEISSFNDESTFLEKAETFAK